MEKKIKNEIKKTKEPGLIVAMIPLIFMFLLFGIGYGIYGIRPPVLLITAAFMTVTYLMLRAFGFSIPTRRLRRAAAWQPFTYGVGQMIFASGFALAGIYGMSRKMYGAEQAGRGLGESIGLGVMGVGGLIAVIGGLLFLGVVASIWWQGSERSIRTLKPVTEA